MQTSLFAISEYRVRRYPGPGFPCTLRRADGSPLIKPRPDNPEGFCQHFGCRMAWLRANGLDALASRYERNSAARDWINNWGKLLYDPRTDGRNPNKRSAMAKMVRAFRSGIGTSADLVVAGAWGGAQIR